MSRGQTLRALVTERLTAAAEEIFALVERTIAEYEEELCRSKEENQRKQQLLNQVLPQQEALVHEFQNKLQNHEIPETPWIKEEPEEQSVKQEEEQLLQFTETSPKTDNIVISKVSSLGDVDEKHNHSAEPFSCTGTTEELMEEGETTTSSPMETEDDGHTSGTGAGEKAQHECPFCTKRFTTKQKLEMHVRVHTGEKPFSCSFCNRTFARKDHVDVHMRTHIREQPNRAVVTSGGSSDVTGSTVLHNVRYRGKKTYINLVGTSYSSFVAEAKERFGLHSDTSVYLTDDTETQVDDDVFTELTEQNPNISLVVTDAPSVPEPAALFSCADVLSLPSHLCEPDVCFTEPKRPRTEDSALEPKQLIKTVLESRAGGERILREYSQSREISDQLRRKLVTIVVTDMVEKFGSSPPMDIRTKYAAGIVDLFPSLKDPFSSKGHEHFFDPSANAGFIAWKLKNLQKELSLGRRRRSRCSRSPRSSGPGGAGGPEVERAVALAQQLDGDQCVEAVSQLNHSSDTEEVFTNMRKTFSFRQKLVHDPDKSSTVFSIFPRLLDTKGLVLQDFELLFGKDTSSKLVEKWGPLLKAKIIKEANTLKKTPTLSVLIRAAEGRSNEDTTVWDSDMASLLLLVYLLPPTPGGNRNPGKISAREAVERVVRFHKSCRGLQEATGSDQGRPPYILAVGASRDDIQDYYIVMNGQLVPCQAESSLSAFDELFKSHYVFGRPYDQALNNMYTFVQTTIYNIDVGLSRESPRVRDMRSKVLS